MEKFSAKYGCTICESNNVEVCSNGDSLENFDECKAECVNCGYSAPWAKNEEQAYKYWDELVLHGKIISKDKYYQDKE